MKDRKVIRRHELRDLLVSIFIVVLMVSIWTSGVIGCHSVGSDSSSTKLIYLRQIQNLSRYPDVTHLLREKIHQAMISQGSCHPVFFPNQANYFLEVTLNKVEAVAATSTRLYSPDPEQRVYTTSLWDLTIHLQYHLLSPDGKTIKRGTVVANSEHPDVLDVSHIRGGALENAIARASTLLVFDLSIPLPPNAKE